MAIGEPTIFVELQGPASACNVVGAGVASEDGGQAAVRGKMRRDQVNEEECEESACKSDYKTSGCHGN